MPIPRGYRPLDGSEHKPVRGARLVGPANPKEKISVTVRMRRRADAPPLPDHEYWMANPPGRRQLVHREDFAERYGAEQADFDKVASFAKGRGLSVGETHAARRSIALTGTVRQMEKAFGVTLGHYRSRSESYRGLKGAIHVPDALAEVVVGVFGLDNRRAVEPGAGPVGASPLTPLDVAKLYNFPSSLKAAGQTIGIVEFGGGFIIDGSGTPVDLNQFCGTLGIPTPKVSVITVGSGSNTPQGSASDVNINTDNADNEVALDLQVAAGIAKGGRPRSLFRREQHQYLAERHCEGDPS